MSISDGVISVLASLVFILLTVGLMALAPLMFMVAWNHSMPSLFNLPELDFWKSLAIVVMAGLLTPILTISKSK